MPKRNLPLIFKDYSKIFGPDLTTKDGLYDQDYVERMHDFSQKNLWEDEAVFAFKDINLKASARALDVGCNDGTGTKLMSKLLRTGFEGIDPSEAAIDTARERYPELAEQFQQYDGEHIPFDDESFDLVCSMHVIGHVASPERFLTEIYRVLKPGGELRVITPNAHYKLFAIIDSVLNSYRPDPTVRRYFSSNALEKMAIDSGFEKASSKTFGEKPLVLRFLPDHVSFGCIRVILKAQKLL